MKVYFCYSKQAYDGELLAQARMAICNAFPPGTDVVESNALDWKELVRKHGQEVAYVEVVSQFDEVVCLEHHAFLGKGLYSQLRYAMELDKPCWVVRWRDNYLRLMDVKRVRVHDIKNWKWQYGVVEIGDKERSAQ